VDIYIPDGRRDKKNVNRLEAQCIAEEIEAILREEKLRGRSIGVVSLLGYEQARVIDETVRELCDASELVRRSFLCGDAATFQGSERDIIFLSLVADSEEHKALSGNTYEQRFNVATSRARDRMFLVRSVTASELSPLDLRLGLIGHFDAPMVTRSTSEPDVKLIDLCDSQFERDVFLELVNRGYRVIPQVESGAYYIDLVVEGGNDARLAIELDGDTFHGPEKWERDMRRQSILERAGWTFWRCFASTWTMRREPVLAELLTRLEEMGITPDGAVERTPNLVERRKWIPTSETLEEQSVSARVEAFSRAGSGLHKGY
jgi:very-short-patch-repair endonuclease